MRKLFDLTGQIFGKLKVLGPSKIKKYRPSYLCECACGKQLIIPGWCLNTKRSESCLACSRIKHGYAKTGYKNKLYNVWLNKRRRWGVCKAWNDFKVFQEWALNNGWEEGLWIHRKCDKGNYNPKNCYIGTRDEQALGGRGKTKKLTPNEVIQIKLLFATKKYTQVKLGELFQVTPSAICYLLHKER